MIGHDHNTLIKRIACERLLLHGITQQGRSRLFRKAMGWYTILIEFQSSSFARGSYLNVGADFHFYPHDTEAFSYGGRVAGFDEFVSQEQFEQVIHHYCDRALAHVGAIEQALKNYRAARAAIRSQYNATWSAITSVSCTP